MNYVSEIHLPALQIQIDSLAARIDSNARSTNAILSAIDARLREELDRQARRRDRFHMWAPMLLPIISVAFVIGLALWHSQAPADQKADARVTSPATPSPPAVAPRGMPEAMPR
jgi:hypothetical protein